MRKEVVIVAGGKGSRLLEYSKKSKTLLKINHKSLLERIIILTKKYNLNKIHLIINKNQTDIINYIVKNKLNINLIKETKPLGDGNCLKILKNDKDYKKKNYLVIYGDLLLNLNLNKVFDFHFKKKSNLTLVVHPNLHLFDSDLVKMDLNDNLMNLYLKPHKEIKSIYALSGLYIIAGKLIENLKTNKKLGFSKKILPSLIKKTKKIFCYDTPEFILDTGTKKRLIMARKIIKRKEFQDLNLDKKQKAIFLDRDGVINKEFLNEKYSIPSNFFKGTIKSIKKIRQKNYLIIIITNQPGVAKGFLTIEHLNNLHLNMQLKLINNKTYISKIYFCPHYPVSGYKKEVKKLKIKCKCRKPENKLVLNAIQKYNIDRNKSFFIGNSLEDYLCAKKSRIKFIKVGDKKFNFIGKSFENLNDAVDNFLS